MSATDCNQPKITIERFYQLTGTYNSFESVLCLKTDEIHIPKSADMSAGYQREPLARCHETHFTGGVCGCICRSVWRHCPVLQFQRSLVHRCQPMLINALFGMTTKAGLSKRRVTLCYRAVRTRSFIPILTRPRIRKSPSPSSVVLQSISIPTVFKYQITEKKYLVKIFRHLFKTKVLWLRLRVGSHLALSLHSSSKPAEL